MNNENSEILPIQDKNFHVNLSELSKIKFPVPSFKPLNTFSISSILYHGDTASIFKGHYDNQVVIIETCTRIPFLLVCREYQYLTQELNQIENIVKIKALTRNTSLGVVSIAYEDIDFVPWSTPIPVDNLIPLFSMLLSTLSKIHHKKFSHGSICRSSIYISPDFKNLTIGCFHAAVKIGDLTALVYNHPCMPKSKNTTDPRKSDLYSAALWFLSYFDEDPHVALEKVDSLPIPPEIISIIHKLTCEDESERISADKASKAIQAFLNPSE
ncbi:hypothetical protein TVAG_036260 [Trichomonas vaginalis G3]|uniref:Protein kinase domain-containing protein n=1 Tax=Trichomonas vaginalis (strain ATCC PRA-98 / G3) TaxID=412133 RepID=A2DAU8_TRIV3|nr:protein kinase-like (PK-like) family [Trichomonas vaginalis G3]EAY22601.1 hypothetical protein TVAG_036260 [Trichomonas vaginalis G3]KAI5497333.1 protein kinase-like (PK-like) family [Trichomonas vaginalis G3]|eukprot:XP_001583587.1 hypothetical protein [Trichomonas vaginalis G3]